MGPAQYCNVGGKQVLKEGGWDPHSLVDNQVCASHTKMKHDELLDNTNIILKHV